MAVEARNLAGGHTMWLESEEGEMLAGCESTGCHTAIGRLLTMKEFRQIQKHYLIVYIPCFLLEDGLQHLDQ